MRHDQRRRLRHHPIHPRHQQRKPRIRQPIRLPVVSKPPPLRQVPPNRQIQRTIRLRPIDAGKPHHVNDRHKPPQPPPISLGPSDERPRHPPICSPRPHRSSFPRHHQTSPAHCPSHNTHPPHLKPA